MAGAILDVNREAQICQTGGPTALRAVAIDVGIRKNTSNFSAMTALQLKPPMPTYVSQWEPKRELQNAKFESYKLSFSDDDDTGADDEVFEIKLPSNAGLPGRTLQAESDANLGFKEARNRAKWNHLACGRGAEVAWIDCEGSFWLLNLQDVSPGSAEVAASRLITMVSACQPATAQAQFILQLPQPIEAVASSSRSPAEYPVARHVQGAIWIATDGLGRAYTIDVEAKALRATFELSLSGSDGITPFRLQAIQPVSLSEVQLLMSTMSAAASKALRYRVIIGKIGLQQMCEAQQIVVLTELSGSDLPSFSMFLDGKCCIGATDVFTASEQDADIIQLESESLTAEFIGTPVEARESTALDSTTAAAATSEPSNPPFSWTQDLETVTLMFPLPSETATKDIKIVFRRNDISLLITNDAVPGTTSFTTPRLLQAKLWDTIDAGVSTWTWEPATSHFGALCLHLEKKNEGVRWTYVFKQDDASVGKLYHTVEETLDRSQLLAITEAMEKYTASGPEAPHAEQTRDNAQKGGILGEFDEDLDFTDGSEGRNMVFTYVSGLNGPSLPQTSHNTEAVEIISMPITTNSIIERGILIKHDVDAMLFTASSVEPVSWTHRTTYPALAFILASKRDVSHVYHIDHRLCFGLETGLPAQHANTATSSSAKRNAYLYYPPPPGSSARTARQKLYSLGNPSFGAILGAVAINRPQNRIDVAVLCEKAVVVLSEVL
ncbi:hypothetical protein EMMF5_002711 [Cystobasidiomycetes sp. EMM_F5]